MIDKRANGNPLVWRERSNNFSQFVWRSHREDLLDPIVRHEFAKRFGSRHAAVSLLTK